MKRKSNLSVGQSKNKNSYRRRQNTHQPSSCATATNAPPAYNANLPRRRRFLPTGQKRKMYVLSTSSQCSPPKQAKIEQCSQTDQISSQTSSFQGGNTSTSEYSDQSDNDPQTDFEKKCIQQLLTVTFITQLVKVLSGASVLEDFMTMLQTLVDGRFHPQNIAFLLCLEKAKWTSLSNTVCMTYRNVTKRFWSIVFRICGGKGIRFFSGTKNFGQIVSKKSQRGKYNPKDADVNFAVPSVRYLTHFDKQYGKIVKPGIIQETLDIVRNRKNMILMTDLKKISPGHRNKMDGDVNLWGHESSPTLKEQHESLDENRRKIKQMIDHVKNTHGNWSLFDTGYLANLLLSVSRVMMSLKRKHLEQRKLLNNYMKRRISTGIMNMYQSKVSFTRTNMYCCRKLLDEALTINKSILECILTARDTLTDKFRSDGVDPELYTNAKFLKDFEVLNRMYNLRRHTELIPQRSTLWHRLRKTVPVTASTMYSALGLRGKKEMLNNFQHFLSQTDKVYTPEVQEKLDYGAKHEVSYLNFSI